MYKKLHAILDLPSGMCSDEKIKRLLDSPQGPLIKRLMDNMIKSYETKAAVDQKPTGMTSMKVKYDNISHKVAVPARAPTDAELKQELEDEMDALNFCTAVRNIFGGKVDDRFQDMQKKDIEEKERAAEYLAAPCQLRLAKEVALLDEAVQETIEVESVEFSSATLWTQQAQKILTDGIREKGKTVVHEAPLDRLCEVIQEQENRRQERNNAEVAGGKPVQNRKETIALLSKAEFRATALLKNNYDFRDFVASAIQKMEGTDMEVSSSEAFQTVWTSIRDGQNWIKGVNQEIESFQEQLLKLDADLARSKANRDRLFEKVVKDHDKFARLTKASFKSRLSKILVKNGQNAVTEAHQEISQGLRDELLAFEQENQEMATSGQNDPSDDSLLEHLESLWDRIKVDCDFLAALGEKIQEGHDKMMTSRNAAMEVVDHLDHTTDVLLASERDFHQELDQIKWSNLAHAIAVSPSGGHSHAELVEYLGSLSEMRSSDMIDFEKTKKSFESTMVQFEKSNVALERSKGDLLGQLDYMEKMLDALQVENAEPSSSSGSLPSAAEADFLDIRASTPTSFSFKNRGGPRQSYIP